MKQHRYETNIQWTGNTGQGTKTYHSYERNFTLTAPGKYEILGSSDHAFRGDGSRYNPEDMLVAALSSCHMLSYLHLCAVNGIVVLAYQDHATGMMEEGEAGVSAFKHVQLNPKITIEAVSDAQKAEHLHHQAHELCFIANSVNFIVEVASVVEKAR